MIIEQPQGVPRRFGAIFALAYSYLINVNNLLAIVTTIYLREFDTLYFEY